jgi:hypothetical protein
VVRENALTKWVYFDLTGTLHSGPLKPKVKTTDTREKT